MRRPERYVLRAHRAYTGGTLLPDGTTLELIRDERDGLARLLRWDPKQRCLTLPNFVVQERVEYCSLDQPEDWIHNVRLPRTANLSNDLNRLAERLCAVFRPLGEDQALLLSAWVLSTWQCARLPRPPQLFLRGPAAVSVLRSLASVCRRGVLLHSSGAVGSFPPELRPTLLVTTPSPRAASKLFTAFAAEQPIWRGASLLDQHTPCAAAYADDARPLADVLNICADHGISALPEDEADRFQSDALGWRLLTSAEPLSSPEIEEPTLQNLVATLEASELAEQVEAAYQRLLEPVRCDVDDEEETAVITGLSQFVADRRGLVYVAEIASDAERRLLAQGSYVSVTPRHAGEVLRRLSIETERVSALGRGVRLSADAVSRIKALATRLKTSAEAEPTGGDAATTDE